MKYVVILLMPTPIVVEAPDPSSAKEIAMSNMETVDMYHPVALEVKEAGPLLPVPEWVY